jgi:prolyl 4-hydroxylase
MKRPTSALHHREIVSTNTITVVDDFLSLADCRRLINETNSGEWVGSTVAHPNGSTITMGARALGRRSDSLVLPAYSNWAEAQLRVIECRLVAMLGVQSQSLEPWQMIRYRRGDFYDYHVDCGAWARHPSGERNRTILIVLEQPSRGGAIHFRALRQTIRAVTGRLVSWGNLLPTGMCNYAMIHSGRPVWQGRKTVLTTWERQRPYGGSWQGERYGKRQR